MLITLGVCGAALALALSVPNLQPPDPNVLVNPTFQSGSSGWETQGKVAFDQSARVARIGPEAGSIRQRYDVPGLRILSLSAHLSAGSSNDGADLRLKCFGPDEKLLLDLKQDFNPKNEAGIYLKTHAFTTHVVVSVEKAASSQTVSVSEVKLQDDDRDRVNHPTQVDLDQYMNPIWKGDVVYDETALLYSQKGGKASGRLLYPPTQIVSVTDSTRTHRYVEGKDYQVEGSTISAVSGSQIPTVSDAEVPKEKFPWLSLAGKHILVTYRHGGKWTGPTPSFQGERFPQTMAKLKAKEPVSIAAFGDSITLGINVSGFRNEPPYMPTWADLFSHRLSKKFSDPDVKLYNLGLGGMTSDWGKDNARSLVGALKPDLVLIAFGMNDFWSYSPEQFRDNTQAMIETIRRGSPNCEFILIGSMRFDPAYTDDPAYVGKLPAYASELRSLTGPGIGLFDMTEMSDALYAVKSQKDLATDPMHPDDFFARWYAQGLVAMFDPSENSVVSKVAKRAPRSFYFDPNGSDSNSGKAANQAWKNLDQLKGKGFVPGDHIVLAAGATFDGQIAFGPDDSGTPKNPIVIESIGSPATIVSKDGPAISASRGGLEIRNLVLKGEATAPKATHIGIALLAKGDATKSHVRISNVEITGFGGDGVSLDSEKGVKAGFSDVVISHVFAHHNFGSGIISADGIAANNQGYAHSHFTVSDCDVSDNKSGSGLVLAGVEHALVEYCVSSNNLGKGGGVGMWAWCAKDLVFRYCISNGTRTNNGGDGGGFDLDGGCVDCVVEHCLSYDNDGPGYMHCDYPTAPKTMRNVIRNSISLDDGRKPKGDSLGFGFVTWGSGLDDCVIQNNFALVTKSDSEKREDGIFFVSYLTGSNTKNDVLHVKDSRFVGNRALLYGTGVAFVRNDLPRSDPGDVLFEGNALQTDGPEDFYQEKQRFSTLSEWQSHTGAKKNSISNLARSGADEGQKRILVDDYKQRINDLIREYRKFKPRDVYKAFEIVH